MTISLPNKLRGRSIHTNVIPTVCSLKNMLEKLIKVNGDVSQLKQWEKRSYKAYQIEQIKLEVMAANKDNRVQLIKEHILSMPPSSIGASCLDIYLVAYVTEEYKPGKQGFFEYAFKNGITDKENSANAIWQVGKGDGVYLGLLNEDGTVRDWEFFESWIRGQSTISDSNSKKYNKLVRDRIPEIIEVSGKTAQVRILKNDEYIRELKRKALEELNEYAETQNREAALEELADLLEVMHALAATHSFTIEEVEAFRKQKAERRGGFKDRLFLVSVEG